MKTNLRGMTLCLGAALALVIAPANAAVQINNTVNLSLSVFIPCAAGGVGEIVDLSGPLHTLVTFTVNGNNVSGYFHFQPQGISGIGETTGEKYQATGVTAESLASSLQSAQANFTSINNFRIIGQGTGNNFLVHETLHLTINANGTVTVLHDNFMIDCK